MEGYNCKGPKTYNNCHLQLFNEESFCMQVEHQCIGCSERGFWDTNKPFYNPMWMSMFSTYRRDAVAHENLTDGKLHPLPQQFLSLRSKRPSRAIPAGSSRPSIRTTR